MSLVILLIQIITIDTIIITYQFIIIYCAANGYGTPTNLAALLITDWKQCLRVPSYFRIIVDSMTD